MPLSRGGSDNTFEIRDALLVVDGAVARLWRLTVPLLIIAGIGLSIIITYFTWAGMLSEKHDEIAARVNGLAVQIETEIGLPLISMQSLRAYMDTVRDVTPDSFARFVKNLRVPKIGIVGYGYAARVDRAVAQDSEKLPYKFVVQMSGPTDEMAPLQGNDISLISGVDDALRNSINFDEARLTVPLDKQSVLPGYSTVLAFYPVFKRDTPFHSTDQRNANVDGVVFAVYDIEGIIGFALRRSSIDDLILSDTIGLSIERVTTDGQLPMFKTSNFDTLTKAGEASFGDLIRISKGNFNVSNMPLRITTLTDLTTLSERSYLLPGTVMLIGLMLTATLSAFAHMLITREEKIKAQVAERTRALQESQERFEDMANVSADWFWETGAEHKFTYFSGNAEAASGLDLMLFLNRSRFEVAGVNLHDAEDFWREHFRMLENHIAFHDFRYTMPRSGTREAHISISGKPLFDANGVFTGYRGSGRDVT